MGKNTIQIHFSVASSAGTRNLPAPSMIASRRCALLEETIDISRSITVASSTRIPPQRQPAERHDVVVSCKIPNMIQRTQR